MSGDEGRLSALLKQEQKRSVELQQQLEKSRAELSEFAVLASHDLRAPLRALSNLADWIEEDLAEGDVDEVKNHLKALRARAHRMDLLLRGLLEFSRVGRRDGAIQPFDVTDLVNAIVDGLTVPPKMVINKPTGSWQIEGRQLALTRVLRHLIDNAITHHDRPEGKIDVEVHDDDPWLRVVVRDDGPGIIEKEHEKAFRPLTTLKRRDEMEASGMGLAVVKRAAEFYADGVTLVSDGRGCCFEFRWPKTWPLTKDE